MVATTNYTKIQAEARWTEMLGDIGVDKLGEGKYIRCAVKVYDDLVDYSDVGAEKAIEQEAKLSTKMSEKEMQRKVNAMVLSNHDKGNFQLGGVANLSQAMASQMLGNEGLGGSVALFFLAKSCRTSCPPPARDGSMLVERKRKLKMLRPVRNQQKHLVLLKNQKIPRKSRNGLMLLLQLRRQSGSSKNLWTNSMRE